MSKTPEKKFTFNELAKLCRAKSIPLFEAYTVVDHKNEMKPPKMSVAEYAKVKQESLEKITK